MSKDTVKFELGQIVYRKILPDTAGIVTGIVYRPHGTTYLAKFADEIEEAACYEVELTTEKSFVLNESKEKE